MLIKKHSFSRKIGIQIDSNSKFRTFDLKAVIFPRVIFSVLIPLRKSDSICQDDYAPVLSVIERCILATDLAQHFRHLPDITDLAARCRRDRKQANLACDKDRHTLQALLMTAADLVSDKGMIFLLWIFYFFPFSDETFFPTFLRAPYVMYGLTFAITFPLKSCT